MVGKPQYRLQPCEPVVTVAANEAPEPLRRIKSQRAVCEIGVRLEAASVNTVGDQLGIRVLNDGWQGTRPSMVSRDQVEHQFRVMGLCKHFRGRVH